jgi:HlyD family secretion protein
MPKQPNIASAGQRPLMKRVLSKVWILAIAVAAIFALGYGWSASHDAGKVESTSDQTPDESAPPESSDLPVPRLNVVRPRSGGVVSSTTQPGSAEAYNYANLFAKVSGYLATQTVDIGDRVKVGQVLAKIAAPELVQAAHQASAELEQAETQVKLDVAALNSAKADEAVAQSAVEEKRASLKQAIAFLEFRKIQTSRMSDLFQQKSIDERLLDKTRQDRDSAEAAENEAQAAVRTAEADLSAKQAIVEQAKASVADAQAKVQVAAARLQKAKVYVDYMTLRSPYNGVVTKRSFHVGDFVRAAEQGGQTPLLTVAETDVMRVVVKMPEDYVPLTEPGDKTIFKVNFTDHVFPGTVSRVANSLERDDKTMRTEIDLPNPAGELRDGMYGYATIELSKSMKGLSIPSRCIVNGNNSKTSAVFVVREGRVHRIPVKIAVDTGVRAEVLSGLRPNDLVVLQPSEDLTDGHAAQPVEVSDNSTLVAEPQK